MKKFFLSAAAAAALLCSGAAQAAATQLNFGYIPFGGSIHYTGANLGSSTQLRFENKPIFLTNQIGDTAPFQDDSGAFLGMVVNLSSTTFNYTIGATTPIDLVKTFTTDNSGAPGSEGLYTVTFTTITAQSGGADFLNLIFNGTVNGPDGFSAPDLQLINCNQSGGSTAAVNCSFTEQAPPIPTPEPASLGLVGLALAGLSVAARRRRRS